VEAPYLGKSVSNFRKRPLAKLSYGSGRFFLEKRRSNLKWKVLFACCLYAAGSETPVFRADGLKSAENDCGCAQSAVEGSQTSNIVLGDSAQASRTALASQQPQDASGFFRSWAQMAERTEAEQPDWLSPIATTSGRLKQEFRYDVWRQTTRPGETVYWAGGKGWNS